MLRVSGGIDAAVTSPSPPKSITARPLDTVTPLLLLVSAVLIGFAIDDRGKHYSGRSTLLLAVAIVCTAVAVLVRFRPKVPPAVARASAVVVGAAVVAMVTAQVISLLHAHDALNLGVITPFGNPPTVRVLAAVALVAAAGVMRRPLARVVLVAAAVVAVIAIGSWVMRAPTPRVDVFMLEKISARTLFHGGNPYDAHVVRFPDLYHGKNYGPSLTNGSVLSFGFPYPPLSLAAVAVSQHWWHDPRRVEFACIALTIAAMFAIGSRRRSALLAAAGAAVFVTTPRGWYIVRSGYIEPLVLLLLAITVLCACRWRRALPYAIGVLVVTKQYAPLLLPLTMLVIPWREMFRRSFLVPFAATAAVCTVPALFATGFWRSVVVVQFLQPFRRDSLSFAAWWANHGHPEPSTALLFAPVLAAIVLCCRYAPHTASGFAGSCALVLLAFFAFAKQAFPNYYFLVIGTLCVAVAAYARDRDTDGETAAVAPAPVAAPAP